MFIPDHVLEEACSQTRKGGANEVGGILLGHLHRDTDSPEIMVEITALVPFQGAQSKLYSLSVTAESWATARNAVHLRNKQEMTLGWYHTHCFYKELCRNCKRVEDKSCDQTAVYMSEKDRGLQRTSPW